MTNRRLVGGLCMGVVLCALAVLALFFSDPFAARAGTQPPQGVVPVVPPPPAPPAAPVPPPPPTVSDVLQSGVLIVVSKGDQRMFVFKDGVPWATSPVSTGKRGHDTPAGVFQILQKAKFHRSNIYSNAPMPFMQRLTWQGVAIHAGHVPGYRASHGCIRVPHAFAQSLFGLTRPSSTTVVVTNASAGTNDRAVALALEAQPRGGARLARAPMPVAPAPSATVHVSPAPQPSAPAIEQASSAPVAPPPARQVAATQDFPLPPGVETIQLAAAASLAEAEAHWQQVLAVFPQLARFSKAVIPAIVRSRQVYRLRASAPDAHAVCAALKQAGQDCFNVS